MKTTYKKEDVTYYVCDECGHESTFIDHIKGCESKHESERIAERVKQSRIERDKLKLTCKHENTRYIQGEDYYTDRDYEKHWMDTDEIIENCVTCETKIGSVYLSDICENQEVLKQVYLLIEATDQGKLAIKP